MKKIQSSAGLLALALLGAGLGSPALAGALNEEFTISADHLLLANLVGEIRVEAASGNEFEIEVHWRGDDATEDLVSIEREEGREARVTLMFPLDESRHYVYPEMGRRSKTTFSPSGGRHGVWGALMDIGRGGKIHVSGRGRGLELWADVLLRVPTEKSAEIYHGVGKITAENVRGNLMLDTASGPIVAREITGHLEIDTGSGKVVATEIQGNLNIDTGSGSVDLGNCKGDEIVVDTGSGGVDAEEIECTEFDVDTGSGGVRCYDLACDDMKIDTGSGSVEIEFVRMGKGVFEIDTGSGSIEIDLPKDASARVDADTGNGSVYVDIDGDRFREKDDVRFKIGDGDARLVLDTGSGSIRINQ